MSLSVHSPTKTFRIKDSRDRDVGQAKLTKVAVDKLRIDPAYQRSVKSAWVEAHKPFDRSQCGAILVSARANGLWVIDGGHRLTLARESGVDTIPAVILVGLTQRQEADFFVKKQRETNALTSFDLWRADLVRGDETTRAIKTILDTHGFEVTPQASVTPGGGSRGPNSIAAIDALRYVVRHYGISVLDDALRLTRAHWYNLDQAVKGTTLKGFGNFLYRARNSQNYSEERLVQVMGRLAPVTLLLLAQQAAAAESKPSSSPQHIAKALAGKYNERLGADRKIELATKR